MSATPLLLSAVRTPIGKILGSLSSLSAAELAAHVFGAALMRAGVSPGAIDEVILGNVISSGAGMALARQAAIKAGCPETISAYVVNKVCGSGLQAVMLAAQSIKSGDNSLVLAGGTESMSNAPYLVRGARKGLTYGNAQFEDALLADGLTCSFEKWHMGNAVEHTARRFNLTRAEVDAFAYESHRKAAAAQASGAFADELAPVEIAQRKGPALIIDKDEGPRADTTVEKLAALKPAFEPNGIVTAGNASSLNDGAAAVVVASEARAKELGVKPLARILGYATCGVPPKEIFHAPALAIPEAVKRAGLKLDQIDLFELNEAFAAQAVANIKSVPLDPSKVNVNGGAVALGHPIGASGARVLVTLVHALRKQSKKYGVASLCLGGGNAVAMVIEAI
jgi:acetyl-CoA C-acetyltransferase